MAQMKAKDASSDAAALDAVEKMLFGAAPVDSLELAAATDPRARRLVGVRALLKNQPKLRAKIEQEVDQAWQKARGDRASFLQSIAERRAQLVSLAEISRPNPDGARVAQNFDDELARYLTEMQGLNLQA